MLGALVLSSVLGSWAIVIPRGEKECQASAGVRLQGIVRTEDGKPVEGAVVQFNLLTVKPDGSYDFSMGDAVRTDREGRFIATKKQFPLRRYAVVVSYVSEKTELGNLTIGIGDGAMCVDVYLRPPP